MFIVGQSFFSYQSIVQNATMHIKLQQLQSEKHYGKVQTTSSNKSIKYVTYEYKKKKDFKHIEDKIIQLKHEKVLPSGSHIMQSELSKIVVSLSGNLLLDKKL
jgi:hypothetical protein